MMTIQHTYLPILETASSLSMRNNEENSYECTQGDKKQTHLTTMTLFSHTNSGTLQMMMFTNGLKSCNCQVNPSYLFLMSEETGR